MLLSIAFRSAYPELSFALFALGAPLQLGFTLFVITLLLNMLARFLVWRVASKTPQEARV